MHIISIEKLRKQRILAESLAQLTLKKTDTTNPISRDEIHTTTRKAASDATYLDSTDSRKSCNSDYGPMNNCFIPSAEHLDISKADVINEKEDNFIKSREPGDYKWEHMNWKTLTNDFSNHQSFQAPSLLTANAEEECSGFDLEQVEYLKNLRHEFQDMPVMMFYNIVRLWHVQQKMLSETTHLN